MKSYRKELWFDIASRRAFVNITREIEVCLGESGVREGLALVNAMHITASVFINDDESGLHQDYDKWLETLAPHEPVSQYPPQPHRRGQRRRPHETPAHGPGGGGGGDPGQARLRSLGADLLRRVRWPPQKARLGEDYRGVTDSPSAILLARPNGAGKTASARICSRAPCTPNPPREARTRQPTAVTTSVHQRGTHSEMSPSPQFTSIFAPVPTGPDTLSPAVPPPHGSPADPRSARDCTDHPACTF